MDKALKQRLVGASVLIILAVIVLPMLLSGRSDTLNTESRQIELPDKPDELSFKTRRFPVGIPERTVVPPAQDFPAHDTDGNDAGDANTEDTPGNALGNTAGSTAGSTAATSVPEDERDVERLPPVASVSLEPAQKPPAIEPELAGAASERPRYLVQVASFSSEKRANAMAGELRAGNLPVVMDVVDRIAGRLHRVRVGPYVQRAEADKVVEHIRSMNKDLSPRVLDTRPTDSTPVSAPTDPLVRWVVQVGSYNNADTANAEVAKLRLAGLTAFSEKVTTAKGSSTYKVRLGPEIDRSRAVQLVKDIKARHNIDGFVTTQE